MGRGDTFFGQLQERENANLGDQSASIVMTDLAQNAPNITKVNQYENNAAVLVSDGNGPASVLRGFSPSERP